MYVCISNGKTYYENKMFYYLILVMGLLQTEKTMNAIEFRIKRKINYSNNT